MNWSKTQLAEIRYFCTSTRSRTPRFLCSCTLKLQLAVILVIFSHYNATEFQISDIKAFYKLLYTPHFSPDQLRAPSPARIAKALERLGPEHNRGKDGYQISQISVRCLGEGRYQITEVSPVYVDDYVNELKYGYEKGYVQYFMEE